MPAKPDLRRSIETRASEEPGATTPRPRLVRRLTEVRDGAVLICAPPGYGKSVLLDQWAEAEARPVVRVCLGRTRDDPSSLLAAIVEALTGERWPSGPAAIRAAGAAELDDGVLERFLRDVAARRGPFVLALDEVENIRGTGTARILEALTMTMPPGSRLALAGRVDPPIRLGRLRANRLLTEIRRADLTMTKDECAAALAQMGLDLSSRRLDAAVRRTEGWPAAVYLLGLALRGGTDQSRRLARFSGSDPLIADYVREELLVPLSDGQRRFLRRVSPLERFSASLCDAVLARDDSEEMIRGLVATNLMRGLDHRGEWFEMHTLVRGLLRVELRRGEGALERSIHARASEWWRRMGFTDFAMDHAAKAGDARHAGEILWSLAPDYLVGGEAPAVLRRLDRLGAPALAASAELSLTQAWCRFATGSGPEAQHWGSVARDLLGGEDGPAGTSDLTAGVALLDAALARRGIAAMADSAGALGAGLAGGSTWRSVRSLLLGVGAQLRGDSDPARVELEEGVHRSGFNAPLVEALCRVQLTLLALDQDDAAGARIEAEKARARVGQGALPESPLAAIVFAASACVLASHGVFDRAGEDLRTAESLFGQLVDHAGWYEVETRVLLARAQAAVGRRREANEHLAAAAAQADRIPDGPVLGLWIASASESIAGLALPLADTLTPAELRVLQLLPTHLSIPQIGESLCVSPNTVKTHTRNIYSKFGVSSRRAAVARAEQGGLIGNPGAAAALV